VIEHDVNDHVFKGHAHTMNDHDEHRIMMNVRLVSVASIPDMIVKIAKKQHAMSARVLRCLSLTSGRAYMT
jgi:hypothetical protein